ncbi:SusC/RagA family TonB-linked outer membrane protein [Niabella beijingensis]|uniref:SusC/RagA family TonB-linked outer membrane protein n=1 Tax=Niabella beijingensis TaxID=2872700 RepID=UPI001CBB7A97|nr:TonB-dependent receptor [Niabella beijingensis]MBZ4192172.1 TonB-dependent receptor [Niabella beijingensis]
MKIKLLLLCLFGFSVAAVAQTKKITGTISDSASQSPVTGASITVPGTTTGTTSAADGTFALELPEAAAQLEVTGVNYTPKTIQLTTDHVIVLLTPLARQIEEVVVVGYGTQKKKDLTGAVATVSGRDVAGRQTIQISDALQGSMAGVTVTRSSGAPGAGAAIRIRGITTSGNNDPLYLVDGVPVSNIDNVNPLDVETISVLKDASSAAIYGSRGAAGVVLITTKRAKNGQSELEYNYEYGVQRPTALPEFVGVIDYLKYFNERAVNDGGTAQYTDAYINGYLDSVAANPNYWFNTDWQDLTLQRKAAPRQRHDLVLTIGTGKLKTKASIGYQNAKAFYDNYDYERYQVRINNDLQISEKLSANLDIAYKRTGTDNVINSAGFGNPIYEGRILPPIYGAFYTDGRFADGKGGRNPMAQIAAGGSNKTMGNQVVGRLAINFKPIKDLTLTALVAPSFDFDKTKVYAQQIRFYDFLQPARQLSVNRPTTDLNESRSETRVINGQFLANYTKTIASVHDIAVLAGYEENYQSFESIGASRQGFPLSGYPYLDVGSQLLRDNSGNAYETALRSFFGRVSYDYKNKYLLQANLRYDKSSRFGAAYRDALFPSFSAGWVVTEERFMKDIGWLSFLKIRGALGEVGNERIGNYPYQANLSPSTALFYQGATVVPLSGYAQVVFNIPDITWETTRTAGIGVDMAFLQNRLNVTADYFSKKTRNILLTRDIPNYVGYADPTDNLGVIGAKGWELELGWRDHIGQLNYTVSANVSDAKTKVIGISNTGALGSTVNIVGEEFNAWYGYRSLGIFQTADEVAASAKFINSKPGDIKYQDMNGDNLIASNADRVILGGSLPRYQYGGNIRMDYKGIDFSLVVQGVGKKLSLMPFEQVQPFAEDFGNMPAALPGRFWSTGNTAEQNNAARFPRLSRASNANNYAVSDFWLVSGAYFRMKNITIGYTLQPSFLKKAGIKSLRFYAAANDLFTIDQFPAYIDADPEAGNFGYPIVRTFMGGAVIRF